MPDSDAHDDAPELPRLLYGHDEPETIELYCEPPKEGSRGLLEILDGVRGLGPKPRNEIIELLKKEIYVDLQATKFDPTYRRLWGRVEQAFGRDRVREALGRLRHGTDNGDAPSRALLKLASFPTLRFFGLVDPHKDAHEELPDLRLWSPTRSPLWLLPYFGFHDALSRGVAWHGESDPVLLDLSLPLGELELGLRLYKGLFAVPTASRRKGRRPWDGRTGWRVAFWLLRQYELRPGRESLDRARDYVTCVNDYGYVDNEKLTPVLETGTVEALIQEAQGRVDALRREVSDCDVWVAWAEEHLLSDTPLERSDTLDWPIEDDSLAPPSPTTPPHHGSPPGHGARPRE